MAGGSAFEVLAVFTRLGLTSFGGPTAHLGYFQEELVERRKWIDPETWADLVALCQFLPGPASSQLAMALGIERAGLKGALAAWLGFTLPSALLLVLFALGVGAMAGEWLHGLIVVAVPVVALAIRSMAVSLCSEAKRATIAVAAAIAALLVTSPWTQLAIMLAAALLGWALFRREPREPARERPAPLSTRVGLIAWALFFALLLGLPLLRAATQHPGLDLFERFYRVGALVFGGGHVVLPLLEQEVVGPGWTTSERFLAGYGAAQAVPGPMFSFAGYLGFVRESWPNRWAGAAIALVAIFLPSFLLVAGALPFWARLRTWAACRAAMAGTNAAVVGLLVAAFYDPVWTAGIRGRRDVALALAAFLALAVWRLPPWLVVVGTAIASGAARQFVG